MTPTWLNALPLVPDTDRQKIDLAEQFLAYRFKDPRLARCALTSPGWVNEHQREGWPTWKALEWQGDAVLYVVLTEHMVSAGRAMKTGDATWARDRLKSNALLAERAVEALWPALFLNRGERGNNAQGGWKSFVSASLEALIGAVWLDAQGVGENPLPIVRELIIERLGLSDTKE